MKREVWMRGPVEGVPPLLQPVAHALLQAGEEVTAYMSEFPDEKLWIKPAGCASVGFHLQHLSGVIDRLFTYARGSSLTDQQLTYLASESKIPSEPMSRSALVDKFLHQVETAVNELKHIDEQILSEHRGVGRLQLASTVIGLLFHAAEHTQRHVGQLLVTSKVV